MKTINNTEVLLKTIEIELNKILRADLKAYRLSQFKQAINYQGATKAA